MERKVIQIGDHTKLLTLPIEFTRRWNISKGDVLHLVIKGKELVIRTEGKTEPALFTAQEVSEGLLERWYAAGFDLIHTTASIFPDPELFTPKRQEDGASILCAHEPSMSLETLLEKIRLIRKHYPKERKILKRYTLQACRCVVKTLPKNPFSFWVHSLLQEMRYSDVYQRLEAINSILPHAKVEA